MIGGSKILMPLDWLKYRGWYLSGFYCPKKNSMMKQAFPLVSEKFKKILFRSISVIKPNTIKRKVVPTKS